MTTTGPQTTVAATPTTAATRPRTIGLAGGMSWQSTLAYYSLVNEEVARRRGGQASAHVVVNSTDFADIIRWHRQDDWAAVEAEVTRLGRGLESAGAHCWLIACVTQHEVAQAAARQVGIPLIHIVDPTAAAVREAGLTSVGLLGTRFTMEREFFTGPLRERHGLEVVLPHPDDRDYLHHTIFEEFARGIYRHQTRARYAELIHQLAARGAQGVILGCTEIPLLLRDIDIPGIPLFDTTRLRALAAVEFSLAVPAASPKDVT